MKKRLFSILLTMVMLIGLVPTISVSAASMTGASEWDIVSAGTAAEVCTDPANVYAGNNSLHIASDGVTTVSIQTAPLIDNTNDTFTLTFYAKGTITNLKCGFFNNNHKNLSQLTGVDAGNGWTKYTYTDVDAGGSSRMTLYSVAGTPMDAYIDNISLVRDTVGTISPEKTGDLFAAFGGIGEVATEPSGGDGPEVTEGTKTSNAPTGWTDKSEAASMQTATSYAVEVSTTEKYQGNNSLHIKFEPAEGETKNASVWYTAKNIANTNQDYTLTFYAKGNLGTLNTNFFRGSAFDLGTLTGEDAGNGWKKYTYTAKDEGGSDKLTLFTSTNVAVDVYLDNITLVNNVTGEDLLEANGGIGELIVTEPEQGGDDDDGDEDIIAAFEPDVTKTALNSYWVQEGAGGTLSGTMNMFRSAQEFVNGNRSLHIQYKSNTDSYAVGNNTPIKCNSTYAFDLDNSGTAGANDYTITFYTKGSTTGTYLQFFTYGNNIDLSKPASFDSVEYDAATGWTKYVISETKTAGPNRLKFIVWGETDLYIDNVTVTKTSDATNTDLLEGQGSADDGEYGASQIFTAKFYDDKKNEITTGLTTALSGKTVNVKAAVANYSNTKLDKTAQLIVCVHDGFELKDIIKTSVYEVSAADTSVLSASITLPEFEEVGELAVQAFLWDSVNGMVPLCGVTPLAAQ